MSPQLRSRSLLLAVATATTFMAGCGTASRDQVAFRGEDAKVADLVGDLQDAAKDESPTRICKALVAKALAAGGCEAKVQKALDDSDTFAFDTRKVTITGDRATAEVIVGEKSAERRGTLRFVREDRVWKISAFR